MRLGEQRCATSAQYKTQGRPKARFAGIAGIAATALVLFAGSATKAATPVLAPEGATLFDILNSFGPFGGAFSVLDKDFVITGFNGSDQLAQSILVTPVIFANPLDGIGFDLNFSDSSSSSSLSMWDDDDEADTPDDTGVQLEFLFEYDVTITDPAFQIKDALLAVSGSASTNGSDFDGDNGSSFISVVEQYMGIGLMQSLMIQDDFAGGTLTSQKFFTDNPQNSLSVSKLVSISAIGGEEWDGDHDDDASVSISFIRQTFSQQIPSPSTTMAPLLVGLLALRRRR